MYTAFSGIYSSRRRAVGFGPEQKIAVIGGNFTLMARSSHPTNFHTFYLRVNPNSAFVIHAAITVA